MLFRGLPEIENHSKYLNFNNVFFFFHIAIAVFLLDDLWSPYFSKGFVGDLVLVIIKLLG